MKRRTYALLLALALSASLGFGGHNGCIAFKKVEG